jgi:hypothetical protein
MNWTVPVAPTGATRAKRTTKLPCRISCGNAKNLVFVLAAVGEGVIDGDGLGLSLGVGDGLGLSLGVGDGLGLPLGVGDGVGVETGVGVGLLAWY